MRIGPTALSRGDAGQSGVAAISVVVNLIAVELPFKVALVPKERVIEVFAPDGPDQSLDESVRSRCAGHRVDFINLKDPKVRPPALETKQRIVIRGKMFRHVLSRDRAVEHPADAGTVEIGGADAKADDQRAAKETASPHERRHRDHEVIVTALMTVRR